MSRALVLGGGGPVGIGWESGLVAGLADAGVDLAEADLILGTSAGSVVGAQLARGEDLADTVAIASASLPMPEGTAGEEAMAGLMDAMLKAVGGGSDPIAVRRTLGEISRSTTTVDEETFLALFTGTVGEDTAWPEHYACTAIDIDTGELQVWDAAAGAPLPRAIASSCSVPAIFPPVTIGGRRYMDGGMKSGMNADVAAGHDVVVAVSCFALELPEGMSDPMFDAMKADTDRELDAVRAAGRLELVAPGAEMLELSGWGMYLMDPGRATAAFEVGRRQAAEEAGRLAGAWG